MLDFKAEWSISFAGCGFMGIYYVGACSCILQRCPRFIKDASKISGASAGALIAAALSVGIPLDKCCADLMFMAKEARKHRLGPFHPAYDLLRIVRDSLIKSLSDDAHVLATGKLCVSLTRVSDRKNFLVSEFDSREELIQALLCSCFVPLYCGVIPPTYRGVRYMDGAVSDNQPRCHVKNTIIFSPYAGESDLCPRASTLNFHEVRFKNMSIQVNSENMYRVTSTFFPPQTEEMAEICQNGYIDALRFLQENKIMCPLTDLISDSPMRSLETDAPEPSCCELMKSLAEVGCRENTQENRLRAAQEHWWLDKRLIEKLPLNIKKALCEACRETHTAGGLLSHMTEYLPKIPQILPVGSACSLAQRLVNWIPDVPKDVGWLYGMADNIYKQAWRGKEEDYDCETSLRRSKSLPSGLNLPNLSQENLNDLPVTPEATPTSSLTFTWPKQNKLDLMPLTPPPTPTCSPTSAFDDVSSESPKGEGRGWGLGKAVGWIRNVTSEKTENLKKIDFLTLYPTFK
ncbi:patatin-like phospholipase domain-containing protein 2 isoform X2 [Cheilinus undulatus]|uniref:patatin-like phospholipase domain-containing protein 2 isoform X2 n=1 Tax=Cheilinus undulatus TaxID=241271 RepID=UPI001BD5403B|nr:patatin-like phospholipase domain-containing protein 2 isoform X2 [Cheilinus undulatus]